MFPQTAVQTSVVEKWLESSPIIITTTKEIRADGQDM
jgi:hypothetical protein